MDDPNAFERQLEHEVLRAFGPPRPVDVAAIVRTATTRSTPSTRSSQRSRWLTLPIPYRRTQRPTAIDTIEYQPSPIPASNGHTPTVIGRTTSMLSPVKAVTAGAIVFAIGGVFLIAQPFDQQSTVPGAATDEGPPAPVEVTGTSVLYGCPDPGTTEDSGIFERTIGGTCQTDWTFSDERLSGSATMVANEDNYNDGTEVSLGTFSLSIENDQGGWRMRPGFWLDFPDAPEVAAEVWVMDGEGAYDGLTAVLLVEDLDNPHGFIFESEMLPPPENASTK